ncbi:hypothetical protein HOC80_03500 [archaeon]|jgi:hypothetical protein|nr:hypothetical protein [archaeon]MBT4417142.1 hypothetical protein [archaeon]
MGKVHTKAKRRFGGGHTLGSTRLASRKRTARPRSFSSEEAAKKWAEAQKIKDFDLKNLRADHASTKKIIIIKK